MKRNMTHGLILSAVLGLALSAHAANRQVLNFSIGSEPPQLNAMKATDQSSFMVIGHTMEGLTRYGANGDPVAGVAESWKIGDKEATFKLRKNAKWSDGKPVTAKDFVFGWRTALDPKTASEYAFILYYIKNAEKINSGKAPLTDLGVKAVDDQTLKIEFEKPCGFFLSLTTFPTYYPVREDFFNKQGEKYAADADKLLYNGPFKLTEWVHGANLKMIKNDNYWNAKAVSLDEINIPYITADPLARFNFFKDKKIDVLEAVGKDQLDLATKEGFKLKSHLDGSLWFMEFNFRDGKPTKNLNLRKAIQYVYNGNEFVNSVVKIPGTVVAKRLIPSWVQGAKAKFSSEFAYNPPKMDLAKAKEFAEKAKKDFGGSIPELVWLTGDSPASAAEAEYFQEKFKALGIKLKIDKQIFKQRLAKMSAGEFDIVSAGWGPDYADPMTFADLWASWNENNRGKWTNKKYDELIKVAQSTSDQKVRMKAMADAEKIGLDDLVVLPTFERTIKWAQHDWVSGVHRNTIGPDPDFSEAKVNRK